MAIAAFFALTGAKAVAAPAIETHPAAVNFGPRAIGEQYGERWVDVNAIGVDPVEVTSFSVTGAGQDQFEANDFDCVGSTLDPGDPFSYCSITVAFDPASVGAKAASLVVEADSGDPVTVPLSGIAEEVASNAPDLAVPALSPTLAETSDLWGFAGGDFEGEGRSGVVTSSQMDDFSIDAGFAYGGQDGALGTPFGREVSAGGFAGDAVTGDFDGDADLDAVSAGGGGAKVFLNDGAGVMSGGTDLPVDEESGIDGVMTAGDFNGDGIEDVLGGYPTYDEDLDETGYMLQMFAGDESGTFAAPVSQQTGIDTPLDMATGDFDDDGRADFAVTAAITGEVLMFLGDGDGTFTADGQFGPGCGCQSPWGVATGDFDGDGRDDVVATMRFEDQVAVYIAQAGGGFQAGQRIDLPSFGGGTTNPYAVSAGDLNGDAKADLVTGDYMSDTMTTFVGNGDGTFSFAAQTALDPENMFLPHGTFIGDFNGDEKPDPSVAAQVGPVAILLNEGEPGQVPSPSSVDFGEVESGAVSTPVTVQLRNEGGLAELRLSDVSIGGGSSGDFAFAGSDCGQDPIPVGDECEVFLVFEPAGPPGERESTLYFGTNHSEETQVEVPLKGMATEPAPPAPGIAIDPVSHDFGNVQVGSASAAQTFKVRSSGDSPLVISQVTMTGSGVSDFKPVSNDCVKTLQPGTTCVVSIAFSPVSGAGAKSATVRVANDSASPGEIAISGTATAKPVVTAPKVLIKKRPRAKIRIGTRVLKRARIAFRSSQAGSRFQCRVDRKKFRSCRSPLVLRRVKPGRHVVRIRAVKGGKTGPAKVIRFRVIRRR